MQIQAIMVTDGGTHSAEKWAAVTAAVLVPLADLSGDKVLAAQRLQLDVADVLVKHYGDHQDGERKALDDLGADHLSTDHDSSECADAALAEILPLCGKSPWADHFAEPVVQAEMRSTLMAHLATAAKEERMHHADLSDDPAAKAWKEALIEGQAEFIVVDTAAADAAPAV